MMIMNGNVKKMNSKSENSDFWLNQDFKVYDIHHFHIDHNAPCLRPKTLQNHCLRFLLGRLLYPGEWLCKILGGKQRQCIMVHVKVVNCIMATLLLLLS